MSFASAIAGAFATLASAEGKTVTVDRGSSSVDVTAVVGESEHEDIGPDGFPVVTVTRDFLIAAADYAPGGSAVEPARGDQITETIDGTSKTFEVCPTAAGQACFRYMDAARTRLRVHTVEI